MKPEARNWALTALVLTMVSVTSHSADGRELIVPQKTLAVNQEYINQEEEAVFLDFEKWFVGEHEVDRWRNSHFVEFKATLENGKTKLDYYDGAVGPGETMSACVWFEDVDELPIEHSTWSDAEGNVVADAGAPLGLGVILSHYAFRTSAKLVFRNDWDPVFIDPTTVFATDVQWTFVYEPYDLEDLTSDLFTTLVWNPLDSFSLDPSATRTVNIDRDYFTESGNLLVGFRTALEDGSYPVTEIWQARLCVYPGIRASSTSWEWCWGTVLAMEGTGDPPIIATNVGWPDPTHSGRNSLKLEDNSPTGTPRVYLAWVTGLLYHDVVRASFWRYDVTPGSSPSCRIWAHWNNGDPCDGLLGNAGSAGGNDDYGPGEGWDKTSWSWTVGTAHRGLVIEARTYSNPGDTVWIDDLKIDAPDHATVFVPCGSSTPWLAVDDSGPDQPILAQVRPNPSGGPTHIRFGLPEQAAITLSIYDASGRRVACLIDGVHSPAGYQTITWDGVDDQGSSVPPGVYMCRLEVGGRVETCKLTLLE